MLPFSVYGPFELLVVTAGATALGVAVWLAGVASADGPSAAPALVAVLGAVVLVAAFGTRALHAQDVGTVTGRGLAGLLASRPAVTVYSKERLALFGPELTATPLPGGPYVVEYGGLRLHPHERRDDVSAAQAVAARDRPGVRTPTRRTYPVRDRRDGRRGVTPGAIP